MTNLCEDWRLQNHLLSKLYPRTASCLYVRSIIMESLSEKLVPKERERERGKIRKKTRKNGPGKLEMKRVK